MASIVLGIGCSHTPQLHTPPALWNVRAERDRQDALPLWFRGRRVRYAELEDLRRHEALEAQIGMEDRAQRLQAAHRALDAVSRIFEVASPDVTLIFGNDQGEMFLDDMKPAFTILGAQSFENMPRTREQTDRLAPGIALADAGHLPDAGSIHVPGHPDVAARLAGWLTDSGFDVAFASRQLRPDPVRAQTLGMPHAYGFIYKQVMREHLAPHVPVDINTHFPPNRPTTRRCYEFGREIGRCLQSRDDDLRVCIVASGGLSHFVVDEAFDRDIMAAMQRGDVEHLLGYDDGYFQAGSSEIRSWIAAVAAMQGAGLEGRVVDYQALYRTPAGTGSSAAFMAWE